MISLALHRSAKPARPKGRGIKPIGTKYIKIFLRCLAILFVVFSSNCYSEIQASDELFRLRLESLHENRTSGIASNPQSIQTFYEVFGFRKIWVSPGVNKLTNIGESFFEMLNSAQEYGLDKNDYNFETINALISTESISNGASNDLELQITESFLLFSLHLKTGKLGAESLIPKWVVTNEFSQFIAKEILETYEFKISLLISALEPKSPTYHSLKLALSQAKEISFKGWLQPPRSILKLGMSGDDVLQFRRLLKSSGYLQEESSAHSLFDQATREAVVKFQTDHNLKADGMVGLQTLKLLLSLIHGNYDILRVNLERWRWMPESIEKDYIKVNIADFSLSYYQDSKEKLIMKTIVGRDYRKTPVFNDSIRYVVINPSWSVPHKIASIDLLPKIQSDPQYLEKNKMKLYKGWGEKSLAINPTEINWMSISAKNFPFRITQEPGPQNALGLVKFMFPNIHDVYLHDTNNRVLFDEPDRAFSSGCIRVEKPIELLMLLMERYTNNTSLATQSIIASNRETSIHLKRPLPIFIEYWTAWQGTDSRIHYRHDLYERDKNVLKGLNASR